MPKSVFVSFEGGEGAGKTTQAERLYKRLQEVHVPSILVHEPGSTSLGWELREILKGRDSLSFNAEILLFAAARAQLVTEVIKPSLQDGFSVIADRYMDSTIAYQGYGRKIKLEAVRTLNSVATGGLEPDLTILLDLTPEEGLSRIAPLQRSFMFWELGEVESGKQIRFPVLEAQDKEAENEEFGRIDAEGQRRFEEASNEFHQRVRKGYLKLARANPKRFAIVNATLSVDEVECKVWDRVEIILNQRDLTSI